VAVYSQRIHQRPIANAELTFEVHAPNVVWLGAVREGLGAGQRALV
jgi:hypothetical protein